MGSRELIESLERTRDEKIASLWKEAESLAAAERAGSEERIRTAREAYDRRRSAAETERQGKARFQANITARRQMLGAEQEVSGRLYALAKAALAELRGAGYPDVFAELAKELPTFPWKTVTVRPDDRELAKQHFPGAEIVSDPAISGGMEAATEEGRVKVVNTLEKRLERCWRELFPLMIRDIYERFPLH